MYAVPLSEELSIKSNGIKKEQNLPGNFVSREGIRIFSNVRYCAIV